MNKATNHSKPSHTAAEKEVVGRSEGSVPWPSAKSQKVACTNSTIGAAPHPYEKISYGPQIGYTNIQNPFVRRQGWIVESKTLRVDIQKSGLGWFVGGCRHAWPLINDLADNCYQLLLYCSKHELREAA